MGHRFRGKKARLEKRRTHCRASTQGDGPIIHQALGGGGFGFVEGVANLSLGHDRGQDQSDRPLVETPGRAEPGLRQHFAELVRRIGSTGGRLGKVTQCSIRATAVAEIHPLFRKSITQIADPLTRKFGAEKAEKLTHSTELKVGVRRASKTRVGTVLGRGMNQQVATWFDLVRIKDPLTREVGVITQGPPAEIHGKGVDVVQLDPVHPLTVVVGQTVLVGCQDFRNHHSLVAHTRINGVAPGFRLQGIGLGSQIFHSVLRDPAQLSLAVIRRSKEELIGPGTGPDHRGCCLAVEQKVIGVQALDRFGKK